MKIAIVHDWLTNMGGAEKIIEIMHDVFPEAPIYTLVYNKDNMPGPFQKMVIKTSFLQKVPFAKRKHNLFLQFMPTAVEQFDLSYYDLVISSSTACAKGVITRADTCHICYCNTPMRYAWDFYHDYIKGKGLITRTYIAYQMNKIRLWDRMAADRVDYFIANSHNVSRRIEKHYRREAQVIYPPVDTDFYQPNKGNRDNYFLCAGRLVGYKRIDLAIDAFNLLKLPLQVVGDGAEYKRLKRKAGNSISFLGRVNNQELRNLYQGCRAFIFPGEEDFGITPLEAQACGRPVIAYGKGGALETILADKTGIFFNKQTTEALAGAVQHFIATEQHFNVDEIRKHADKFNITRFKSQMEKFIMSKYEEYNTNMRRER
ncbi:MAG: glycosyltransferase [Bacillota bacterium]